MLAPAEHGGTGGGGITGAQKRLGADKPAVVDTVPHEAWIRSVEPQLYGGISRPSNAHDPPPFAVAGISHTPLGYPTAHEYCGVTRTYKYPELVALPEKWYVSPRPRRTSSGDWTYVKGHEQWQKLGVHQAPHVDPSASVCVTLKMVPAGYGITIIMTSVGRICGDTSENVAGLP